MPSIARKLVNSLFHTRTRAQESSSNTAYPDNHLARRSTVSKSLSYLPRSLRTPSIRWKNNREELVTSQGPTYSLDSPSLLLLTKPLLPPINTNSAARSTESFPSHSTPDLCYWSSCSTTATSATPFTPATQIIHDFHDVSCLQLHTSFPADDAIDEERDFVKLGGRKLCHDDAPATIKPVDAHTAISSLFTRPTIERSGSEAQLLPHDAFACTPSSSMSSLKDENNALSSVTSFSPDVEHDILRIEAVGWTVDRDTGRLKNTMTLSDFGVELEDRIPVPDGAF